MTGSSVEEILSSMPAGNPEEGTIELLVVRPQPGLRREMSEIRVCLDAGVMGDYWNLVTPHYLPAQVTAIRWEVLDHLSGRTGLPMSASGDNLVIRGMDVSENNLPVGSLIRMGEAVLQVTADPHLSCRRFSDRFGVDAARAVRTQVGRSRRWRGMHLQVHKPGVIKIGSLVSVESRGIIGNSIHRSVR